MSKLAGRSVFAPTGLSSNRLERLSRRVETGAERSSIAVRTPIGDDEIGTIPACTAADVERAVDRARRVQPQWAATSIDERASVLERFAALVSDNRGNSSTSSSSRPARRAITRSRRFSTCP